MQPLLADRVGLKPRITEGYERATGLIAALSRARDEKDFREWPSHIGRDARLQARDPFRYRLEGAALAPLLEGVAENAALRRFRPTPGYGARRFQRACAVKRMASRAFSLVKTGRPLCACSLCRGSPRQRGRGRPFLGNPEGFRLASLPSRPLRGRGGDDERGTLRRDAKLHIRACVRSRHGVLRQAAVRVVVHGAVDADPQRSREGRWSRGLLQAVGREEGSRRGACSSAVAPRGGVRKASALIPNVARALNPASARHYPAWPYAARFVRASCSAARPSPSRS